MGSSGLRSGGTRSDTSCLSISSVTSRAGRALIASEGVGAVGHGITSSGVEAFIDIDTRSSSISRLARRAVVSSNGVDARRWWVAWIEA